MQERYSYAYVVLDKRRLELEEPGSHPARSEEAGSFPGGVRLVALIAGSVPGTWLVGMALSFSFSLEGKSWSLKQIENTN